MCLRSVQMMAGNELGVLIASKPHGEELGV
jgi:hypothetical protein